jgi:hypothetical protein
LSAKKLRLRCDLLPSIATRQKEKEKEKEREGAECPGVELGKNDIYSLNSKLKESLLTMSREYYRSKKSVKTVFHVSSGVEDNG